MFTHTPHNFEELNTVDLEAGRGYLIPGEDMLDPWGLVYPSITTVLQINSEQGIKEWRKRVGNDEANRISARATRKGTHVHKMCEDYINNELPSLDGYNPIEQQSFNSIKPVLDQRLDNIVAQEAPLYSRKLRIAGRVDCIAEFDNQLSIIDFKTASKPKKEQYIHNYFAQCAAYTWMFGELTGLTIKQNVVIIAVENEQPQVFITQPKDWYKYLTDTRKRFHQRYKI